MPHNTAAFHNVMSIVIFIQFNFPFKIISLIEMSQSIGGAKREYPDPDIVDAF